MRKTTTTATQTTARQATIKAIARETFGIETLERRNRDHLDFHDVAVWEIQKALEAAYAAGAAAAAGYAAHAYGDAKKI